MLLGQVLIDAGRREEAAEHYLNGLAVAESNDFRMMQGELLARLGEVETDRSQRKNYLQRSQLVLQLCYGDVLHQLFDRLEDLPRPFSVPQ